MTDLEIACRKFASVRFLKMVQQAKDLEKEAMNQWVDAHWKDYEEEMRAVLGIPAPQNVA